MMNDTILLTRAADQTVSSCSYYQESSCVEMPQCPSAPAAAAAAAVTIEIPFAPWMVVILCFMACIIIGLLSPEVPDINDDDIDSVVYLQRPLLHQSLSEDGSSQSSLSSLRDETANFRHVSSRYAKVRDFVRNKMRRQSKRMHVHQAANNNNNTKARKVPTKDKQQHIVVDEGGHHHHSRTSLPHVQHHQSSSVRHSPRPLSPRKMMININAVNNNHQNHGMIVRQPVAGADCWLGQPKRKRPPFERKDKEGTVSHLLPWPQLYHHQQHQPHEPQQQEHQHYHDIGILVAAALSLAPRVTTKKSHNHHPERSIRSI
jgi:hypothetical protein